MAKTDKLRVILPLYCNVNITYCTLLSLFLIFMRFFKIIYSKLDVKFKQPREQPWQKQSLGTKLL